MTNMKDVMIATAAQVVCYLAFTLIGVFGAWLTAKLGKRVELTNINKAKDELIETAQQTVMELQQTIVDGMKAASSDGKLSEDEIKTLGIMLIEKTKEKMSGAAIDLLVAASVDVNALIRGAGEALISQMHNQ